MHTKSPIALLCCAWLALPGPAAADGIPAYWDDHTWRIAPERAQFAVVALAQGQETLLLRVDLGQELDEAQAKKLVWVTPIPAQPAKVRIDVLHGFPSFGGVMPGPWLLHSTREAVLLMAVSQLGPVLIVPLFMLAGKGASPGDLNIHTQVHKAGVELSVVEAASTAALAAHLESLGVAFPAEGLKALEPSTGPAASLVVFRIEDFTTYREATRSEQGGRTPLGIQVTFPAEQGYFPLVVSSALPGDFIEVVVTAVGHHQAFAPFPRGLGQSHYLGHVYGEPEVLAPLGVTPGQEIPYTRFSAGGRPQDLTADLRFAPGAPAGTRLVTGLIQSPAFTPLAWAAWFLLFILLAVASNLIARLFWPKADRPRKKTAALLGLFNLLTWIGYLVALLVYDRRRGRPLRRTALVGVMANLSFCALDLALVVLLYAFE